MARPPPTSGQNSVFTAMSNLLFLGAPGRIQSYIVSGVGLVRLRVSLNQTSVDRNVIGYDLGGGVNGFFTKHVRMRGDVRYVHTFQDVNVLLVSGKLAFWRASLGPHPEVLGPVDVGSHSPASIFQT